MRIVFAGVGDFSLSVFAYLNKSNHQIIALVTSVDKKAHRGQKIYFSQCKQYALNNHIPIFQTENINSEKSIDIIKKFNPDIVVVVAYGAILSQEFLANFFTVNIHASLLPKYRGASPIQQAILNNDSHTGLTLMKIELKMDAGAIGDQIKIAIAADETTTSLTKKLKDLAGTFTACALDEIAQNQTQFHNQDESQASYCQKIYKTDAKINFLEDRSLIERKIRAYNPYPIAYCDLHIEDKKYTMRIHQAKIALDNPINPFLWNLKAGDMVWNKKQLWLCCYDQKEKLAFLEILKVQLAAKKIIWAEQFIGSSLNKLIIPLNQQKPSKSKVYLT